MLQPPQIEQVSLRYADEIVELRDFLAQAGVAIRTPGALREIVGRLSRDRAFHRDLTSYIWVAIDQRSSQISYSDLLGVLAIAAAGARLAAEADEDDAHNLLRFLMEARHALALHPVPESRDEFRVESSGPRLVEPMVFAAPPAPVPPAAPPPPAAASPRAAAPPPEPQHVAPAEDLAPRLRPAITETSVAEEDEDAPRRRNGLVWAIVAACLIAIAAVGWWLYQRRTAENGYVVTPAQQSTVQTAASSAATGTSGYSTTPEARRAQPNGSLHRPTFARNANQSSGQPTVSTAPTVAAPSASIASSQPSVPPQHDASTPYRASAPRPTVASVAPVTRPSAPVIRRYAGTSPASSAATAISNDALSKQVGARTVPTDLASYGVDSNGRKTPVLKRRSTTPAGAFSDEVADARFPSNAGFGGSNRAGTAGPTPRGIVRAGSEGTMSAYVLYSPTPVYPSAAAAAHVQGQVKVRATVDRDGSVAAVSIISGPPLLRDAALEAVQHWRYRPYTSRGKAVPITTTAIVDFELQ